MLSPLADHNTINLFVEYYAHDQWEYEDQRILSWCRIVMIDLSLLFVRMHDVLIRIGVGVLDCTLNVFVCSLWLKNKKWNLTN